LFEKVVVPAGVIYTNALLRLLRGLIRTYGSFGDKLMKCDKLIKYLGASCVSGLEVKNQLATEILEMIGV
jgi:hypothetical protein